MNRLLSPLAGLLWLWMVFAGSAISAAEPQWIWGTKDAQKSAPPGACHFRKAFTLAEPESGLVEITCDNRYVLRLNGRLVGASNNWMQMDRYDVTPLLVAGENVLDVRCINDGDAAGLAVRVTVKSKGQPEQTHSTDGTWETRLNVGKSWNPSALAEINPVETFVLGELGKLAPWGNGAKPGPIVRRSKPADDAGKPFELLDGDRVVWLGNTFIERAQTYDYLETALTIRWPERNITFRNLGWSGDTVTGIARARFGDANEGFRHLTEHVYALKPTVIFVAYGANESFAGEAGLDQFRTELNELLDTLEASGARIVLISPLRQENLGPPLPDPTKHNQDVAMYAGELRDVASARGMRYLDLDGALFGEATSLKNTPITDNPLTNNGLHLTALGYWHAGVSLLQAAAIPAPRIELQINVNDGKVATHGSKISKLQHSEKQVTFTALDECLPYVLPPLAERFGKITGVELTPFSSYRVRFLGLKPGEYILLVDGEEAGSGSAKTWETTGLLTAIPQYVQLDRLRKLIQYKNQFYFHRWRPENETYLYLFRKHEQGNNAKEIPEFDPLVEKLEQEIARLRQPVPHKFELRRVE